MAREIKIERQEDLRDQIIAQNNETVPGVERAKPLTDLDEYEDDSDIFEMKPKSVLKEYQKDVVENDIKKKLSKRSSSRTRQTRL